MSIGYIVPANANVANTLHSTGPGITAALNGSGTFNPADSFNQCGIKDMANNYSNPREVCDPFYEYNIQGIAAGEVPISVFTYTYTDSVVPSKYDTSYGYYWHSKPMLDIECRVSDWGGGPVNYQKWVKPEDFGSGQMMMISSDCARRNKVDSFAGGRPMMNALSTAQVIRLLFNTSSFRKRISPDRNDGGVGWDFGYMGYNQTPGYLFYNTAKSTTQLFVADCSIQMNDLSIVYLSIDSGTVQLRRTTDNGNTSTLIATITTNTNFEGNDTVNFAFNVINGQKSLALVRDKDDTIYVVGASSAADFRRTDTTYNYYNKINIQAFVKNDPNNAVWTAMAIQTVTKATDDTFGTWQSITDRCTGDINNISAVYHNIATGIICVAAAHSNGSGQDNQLAFYVIACERVKKSTSKNNHIETVSQWLGANLLQNTGGSGTDYDYPCNDTGTGLDQVVVGSDGAGNGIVVTYISPNIPIGNRPTSKTARTIGIIKYKIASDGSWSTPPTPISISSDPIPFSPMRDGNAKIRLLTLPSGRYAVITAAGIAIFNANNTLQYTATNGNDGVVPLLGLPYDPGQNKDDRGLHFNPNWDVMYNPATAMIVMYSIDCSPTVAWRSVIVSNWSTIATTTAPVSSRTLATLIGPSGSRNIGFRIPRQIIDVGRILLHLANVGADRSLSTLTVVDSGVNSAPLAPVLGNVSTFQANKDKIFTWTYSDPDGHSQSAYQIQIRRVSDNVVVWDSGKVLSSSSNATIVANTLVNNTAYQWRALNYDAYDLVGPFSGWSSFSTTSAPVVTVTDPKTDGQQIQTSSYIITWQVDGGTQAKYQVKVIRSSDSVVLSDSGTITDATARSYLVKNLVSDIDQIIQVYVTDNNNTLSPPGLRTVRPNYARPQKPIATITPMGLFIRLDIINPTPGTDQDQIIRNDIYRRLTGGSDSDWIRIAQVSLNGQYDDYTVGSGRSYDYRVDGVS